MASLANRKALLGELGVEEEEPEPIGGDMAGPRSDNTGFAGGGTMPLEPQPIPGVAGPIGGEPRTVPSLPSITGSDFEPKLSGGSSPPGVFQSGNASARGYLDEAIRAFAPTVQGIRDEAGRKAAVEQYVASLLPEIQKRGGNISDIKGEKARLDGRLIDFYRDIEGAADPQMLDITDEGMGGAAPLHAGGLSGMLGGDPNAAIQDALSRLGNSANLQALLEQLSAGSAV